jgi:hypothetical protein
VGLHFDDVPLPGLDVIETRQHVVRRTRRADASLRPTEAARNSFWRRVIKAPGTGCWIFAGAISSPDGYGRIAWRCDGRERTLSAHRFALEMALGPLDEAVVAEHKCNEPLCVRVGAGHVIQSTQRDNLAYAVSLGRAGTKFTVGTVNRYARSVAVRAAVAGGWDRRAYLAAIELTERGGTQQYSLFD